MRIPTTLTLRASTLAATLLASALPLPLAAHDTPAPQGTQALGTRPAAKRLW